MPISRKNAAKNHRFAAFFMGFRIFYDSWRFFQQKYILNIPNILIFKTFREATTRLFVV